MPLIAFEFFRAELLCHTKAWAVNRQIQLKNNDYKTVSQRIQGVEHLTARYPPPTETSTCRYKEKYAAYNIKAITPDCRY